MGRLNVRIVTHIDEIDPRQWDAVLRPGDLLAAHRFVRAVQNSNVEQASYQHFLISEGGSVVCVGTLSRISIRLELLASPSVRSTIQRVRQGWPSWMQVGIVLGGLPVSFGQSCLRFSPMAPVTRCLSQIAEIAEDFACKEQVGFIAFKEFSPEEERCVGELEDCGYFRAPSLPGCVLPLPWRSFTAYVGHMRAGYRRQVKQTLAMRKRAGLTVRWVTEFSAYCETIFRLYEQVMDRAPHQLERLNLDFFRHINQALGPAARALLVEKGSAIVAAAIVLRAGQTATFLIAGIDYEQNRETQAYLNLLTEIVADAIRSGSTRLELGQTSYAVKSRLGGQLQPRILYLRHRNTLLQSMFRASRGLLFPETVMPARRVFKRLDRHR